MSSSVEAFQLSVEAAEAYEARFVPALFAEWAGHLADAAGIGPGRSVLDVACGTGAVTRVAADRPATVGSWDSTSTRRCSRWPGGSGLTSNGVRATPLTCPSSPDRSTWSSASRR